MKTLHTVFALLILTVLGGVNAARASYPPAGPTLEGRVDTIVTTDPEIQDAEFGRGLVIDSAGRIFAAVEAEDPVTGNEIHVYRSIDDGETFELWARRYTNDERKLRGPALALVPGAIEHLALAYTYTVYTDDTPSYQTHVNVAVAQTDAALPAWTVRTVFDATEQEVLSHSAPDVDAVMGPDGPIIYVTAGQSLWGPPSDGALFTRSTDLGATWSTPFELANADDQTNPRRVRVAGDEAGNVVVSWVFDPAIGTDNGVARRTADGFAAQDSDWDVSWTALNTGVDGWFSTAQDVAAQPDGSGFVIFHSLVDNNDPEIDNLVKCVIYSTATPGGAWTKREIADVNDEGLTFRTPRIEARPGGGWILTGSPKDKPGDVMTWSVYLADETVDPTFDEEVLLADAYAAAPRHAPGIVAVNPLRGGYGMLWMDDPFELSPVVRFDASWWSAPGAPALVEGFPKNLAAEPVTHPAVIDVSARSAGDEIVFGDAEGLVHVLDEDGNELPGWPQSVGTMLHGQAIAVGDLDGDGTMEIVVGNASGEVHVMQGDGTRRAGWPVDLGVRPAYVSLGTVSKLTALDVVAVCETSATLLRPDGTVIQSGAWPVALANMAADPAALGDLDGDGRVEVVVTAGNELRVFDREGDVVATKDVGADAFATPASLADLDRDGDLEIFAATLDERVLALHHDGGDLAGLWPVTTPGSGRVAGVTVANVDGSGDPEVVVTRQAGVVSVLTSDGSLRAGWPVIGPGDVFAPAIVDDIDGLEAEVLFATDLETVHARATDGQTPFAWPGDAGSPTELSPATGDVDGDGELDLIVLTTTSVVRFDIDSTVSVDDFMRWTQFGHDAQRTFCAAGAKVATGVESAGSTASVRIAFAPAFPNPTSSGRTTMQFSLPRAARTRVEMFDVRGRRVRVLADGVREAGQHAVLWDGRDGTGRDVGTGTYFGRLVVELPDGVQTLSQKVTVMQ